MKTKEEILNQTYMSVNDLQVITGLGKNKCTEIMSELKDTMVEKGMFIPLKKKLLIPTKMIRKKMSI